ncbi:hypothetical protein [Streptomyces sp. NPDC057287]|uniref:hypothetical protein n=1 Tax=Streptomyces sp. NPDC057287 TaxID=3346086 RepID=UPI00363D7A2B
MPQFALYDFLLHNVLGNLVAALVLAGGGVLVKRIRHRSPSVDEAPAAESAQPDISQG